jgi:hypothetical protein
MNGAMFQTRDDLFGRQRFSLPNNLNLPLHLDENRKKKRHANDSSREILNQIALIRAISNEISHAALD